MRIRFSQIQALRFYAAGLVVIYHLAGQYRVHGGSVPLGFLHACGFAGVDIFFVVSGFIIWISSSNVAGVSNAAAFAWRRAWRIYSAYLPALGIAGVILYMTAPAGSLNKIDWFASATLEPSAIGALVLPVSWSLTYELYFYAAFALMIAFRRYLFPHILVAMGVAVMTHIVLALPGGKYLARTADLHYMLNPLVLEFLMGCIVAVAYQRIRPQRLHVVIAIFGLVAFAAGCTWFWSTGQAGAGLYGAIARVLVFGGSGAVIVLGLALTEASRPASWVLVRLGDVSYTIYLLHLPLISLVFWLFRGINPLVPTLLSLVCIIPVCLAFYHLVENPLRRLPRRLFHSRELSRVTLRDDVNEWDRVPD